MKNINNALATLASSKPFNEARALIRINVTALLEALATLDQDDLDDELEIIDEMAADGDESSALVMTLLGEAQRS